MKSLLLGKDGQLGQDLHKSLSLLGEVHAFGKNDCNLNDQKRLTDVIRMINPEVIVNAAAYTKVDEAENNELLAHEVNTHALEHIGLNAKKINACVVHFSTDYVFDGKSKEPYKEDSLTQPINIYGLSKVLGEEKLRSCNKKHIILRTSWVVSPRGNNFLTSILKLAKNKKSLSVVCDQFGSPISTESLATNTCNLLQELFVRKENFPFGTYHLSSKGPVAWFDYAKFILDEAHRNKMSISLKSEDVLPVSSSDYKTLARRPTYSYLDSSLIQDTFNLNLPYWQDEIRKVIETMTN